MSEPHQSLEEILFDLALQKSNAADRVAFLDRACQDNPILRASLDELLESHFGAAGFLLGANPDKPPLVAPLTPVAAPRLVEAPAQMIGRYKLLERIGEGGFGEVWMAEQREPVKRRVALKVIKLGMDSRHIVARFEAERQALALMDHPNIAKILDAGTTDTGRPYFVMELVRGIKITDYCDQSQLSTPDRLRLFIEVCKAVQHAHQKGIIHRDLKPSNILVTLHDGVPVPKVIDFGIAKATQQELTDKTVFTQFQHFIGTPAYISPEQAEMSGLDIDTRSDIYSLGVLLYELLVGQTPFDAKEMVKGGLDALRRMIRERVPLRPSTKLNTLMGEDRTTAGIRRQTEVGKLAHQLKGDLDWIVMKCLEKDRTRRYETANGLAADIQRHLDNETIVARPPSTAYRFKKAFQRNKFAFIAAAAVAVALLVGISISTRQMIRATKAEQEQSRLRERAESERGQALEAQASEVKHRQSAEQARQQAQALELKARRLAYTSDMNLVQQSLQLNNLGRARVILNRHRPKPDESDLRGWEWRYLWRLCQSDALFTLCQKSNRIYGVSFSHDGHLLAVQDSSSEVSIWDLASRKPILSRRTDVAKQRIAFSPVTRQLAFCEKSSGDTWEVILWDVAKGEEVQRWKIPQPARELVFTRDGKGLAVLTDHESAGYVFLWDIASGRLLTKAPTARDSRGEGNVLAMSDLSQTLAVGSSDGRVTLLDAGTGREQRVLPVTDEHTMALAMLNGGAMLASAGGFTDPVIKLWDVASGGELVPLKGHRSYIHAMAMSPDGRLLASGSGDQTIRIWDWKQGRSVRTLRGHSSQVFDVAFSPDGQTLASGSRDGTVKLWDLSESAHEGEMDVLPDVSRVWSFSPDGARIVAVVNGAVRCWTTAVRQEDRRFEALGTDKTSIVFSDSGRLLAIGSEKGDVLVVHPQTGAEIHQFNAGSATTWVLGFGDEDRSLVTVDSNGVVIVWDFHAGQNKHQWIFPERPAHVRLARTADVLVTRYGGRLAAWRTRDGQELWTRPVYGSNPPGFSYDGKVFAVPSGDGFTKMFDALSGTEIATLAGSLLGNHSVGFSSDNQRLAIGSDGMEAVQVWDPSLEQILLTLEGQGWGFGPTEFSPDGRFLGSCGRKGLHLWRAPSWEEIDAAEAKELKP